MIISIKKILWKIIIKDNKKLINSRFIYSAIKISINKSPVNSVLYPLTSSLSPSDRSKGARWVSMIVIIKKTTYNKISVVIIFLKLVYVIILVNLSDET